MSVSDISNIVDITEDMDLENRTQVKRIRAGQKNQVGGGDKNKDRKWEVKQNKTEM